MASATHPRPVSEVNSHADKRRTWLHFAVAVVAVGLVFSWIQFSTRGICCGDFDGYYHIAWSRALWDALRQGDFPPPFPWLPLTTLNSAGYADQHLLFHLLLVPFTWLGDLRLGAKLAAALFGSLAVLSCYWLILRSRIPHPWVWLLGLLACSSSFLYRMNMAKAPGLSILFLVIGTVLLFERKYAWLALVSFLYVWSYNLFVLLGLAALIWVAVVWWAARRLDWQALLWTGVGTAAGLIIHPYFPKNLRLLLEHVRFQEARELVGAGVEWFPMSSWLLLKACFVAFAATALGYLAFGYLLSQSGSDRDRIQRPAFFLLFSSVLLLLTLRAMRFIEYWPPFAVLFLAFTLQAVWEAPAQGFSAQATGETESPALGEGGSEPLPGKYPWFHKLRPAPLVALALAVVLLHNLREIRGWIPAAAAAQGRDDYEAAAEWLGAHVPAGDVIFNVSWASFPKLFFYDRTHRYVAGLDPGYLWDEDPQLGRLYQRISRGEEPNAAALIRRRFGAQYVFLGAPNLEGSDADRFFIFAKKTAGFEPVFDSKTCTILRVGD